MLESIKNVHLIGAGGIGLSAVGKFLLHKKKRVTGSDVVPSEQVEALRKMGASIRLGHSPENIAEDVDLIIYSPAVPEDNPERAAGRERGLIEMSYPQFLGELSKLYRTIAITGTHGKSTTTAMIGLIFEAAGYDPTVIVGSKVSSWKDGNLRMGDSEILVVEACEHMGSMLHLNPEMIVLTNVEEDHLDYYKTLENIKKAFQEFLGKASATVVVNADDKNSVGMSGRRVVKFGTGEADYCASDRAVKNGRQTFSISYKGESQPIELMIPGSFNMMNATAAFAATTDFGVVPEVAAKTLETFPGVWRRFERIGVHHDADLVSDYGHHPTAIKRTLEGARELFPNRRIVLCFQPHQHARTKDLFDEFIPAFDGADVLLLPEIYAVSGRLQAEGEISSKDLLEAVKKHDHDRGTSRDMWFTGDLKETGSKIRDVMKPEDVVIIMGAGDIDEVARTFR